MFRRCNGKFVILALDCLQQLVHRHKEFRFEEYESSSQFRCDLDRSSDLGTDARWLWRSFSLPNLFVRQRACFCLICKFRVWLFSTGSHPPPLCAYARVYRKAHGACHCHVRSWCRNSSHAGAQAGASVYVGLVNRKARDVADAGHNLPALQAASFRDIPFAGSCSETDFARLESIHRRAHQSN